jgi:hypothetical protein
MNATAGKQWRSPVSEFKFSGSLLFFFLRVAVSKPPLSGNLLQERSPVLPDPRRGETRPSSELRPVSLDWHSLSAFLFHRPGPDRGSVWAPTSRPPRCRELARAYSIFFEALQAYTCLALLFRTSTLSILKRLMCRVAFQGLAGGTNEPVCPDSLERSAGPRHR